MIGWEERKLAAEKALDKLDESLENGIMDDERYKKRSAIHSEVIRQMNENLSKSNKDAERWLELAKEVFNSVVNIGDVFEKANNEERRRLMELIGSNWILKDKNLKLIPRTPYESLYNKLKDSPFQASHQAWLPMHNLIRNLQLEYQVDFHYIIGLAQRLNLSSVFAQ